MMTKNILKNIVLVIVGILIGGTGIAYLSQKASEMHVEIIQATYEANEDTAARQAIKDEDYLLAVHHFKNLSESYSDIGIEAFTIGKDSWDLLFPFKAMVLKKIEKSDPEGIGERRICGIYHGMLAYSLEKSGMKDRAQNEWQVSTTLLEKESIAETRKLIESLMKI